MSKPCDVLACPDEACDEPELDRIEGCFEDDWSACVRGLRRQRGGRAGRGDHGRLLLHEIGHHGWKSIGLALRPAIFDFYIAAIDVATFGEAVEKTRHLALEIFGRLRV